MACDVRAATIFLEAASVSFGAENLDCVTPVAGLSGGEYFEVSSPAEDYYVWLDIDDGSADPAVPNRTGIEVDVTAGYTVADYIAALVTAMEAVTESGDPVFLVNPSTDGLSASIQSIDIGAPLNPIAAGTSTFTVENDNLGYGGNLGRTKEGIEITFENTVFDVQANQTGLLLLDQIIQSTGASLSAAFLELTEERLRTIIGNGFGDTFTPSGVGATDLIGFGTSRNFQSSFDLGGKLILHPIRLPVEDRSRDVVFHVTLPNPESINYDGTDTQALSCSFTALQDDTKDSKISVFAIGDWKQDLRA